MKESFAEVYGTKADADRALGYIEVVYPENDSWIADASTRVNLRWNVGNQSGSAIAGELDDDPVYLVLSIAK